MKCSQTSDIIQCNVQFRKACIFLMSFPVAQLLQFKTNVIVSSNVCQSVNDAACSAAVT